MKYVAEDKLQFYVEILGVHYFHKDPSIFHSLLQGLGQAMALPKSPNNCWNILCSTTEKIFALLPNQIQV